MTPDSAETERINTIRIATDNIESSINGVSYNPDETNNEGRTVVHNRHDRTQLIRGGARRAITVSPHQWVQGWLVAITGPMKGQYFPLVYGYNHIGRDASNNICLAGDKSISKHQLIIHYNKNKRSFFASKDPRTNQLTLTEDEDLILSDIELEPGSNLLMSDATTLKLIPFCDADFTWDYNNLQDIVEEPVPPPAPVDMPESGQTVTIDTEELDTQATVRYERSDESVTKLIRATTSDSTEIKPLSKEAWVQGWLVAISGPMKGRAYALRYGFNHIGRKESNTIVLAEDAGISGEQILIVYNRKRKTFYVEKSPQSTQITEFEDGDIVNLATELKPGSLLIMTGETTLRFIPLCGENFAWDYTR